MDSNNISGARWSPAVMKWGPNDAGHIIWALGEFLFMFFLVIAYFLQYIYIIIYKLCTMEELEVGSKENGPKQCQSRHLGSR